MRNLIRKIILGILLVFSAGVSLRAQSWTYKSVMSEIQTIQKQLVPDKRVAILDISLNDTLSQQIILKGETNLPEGKSQILKVFKSKGIQFIDSVRIFPDSTLVGKIWGLSTLSVSNIRLHPAHSAELVSQAMMGTPMKLLDYQEGWYRVQTPDNYIGWMDESGLKSFSPSEIDRWKKANRYVFNRISGNALASANRKGTIITDLVLGDLFEVEAEVKGFLKLRIPDGRTGFVRKSDCISWQNWSAGKPDVQAIISVAKQLLGSPYLWGGTSSKAVDCSGLTRIAYYSQGIILARDASQQASYGQYVDLKDIQKFEPGDLLFFGRDAQHIIHVGIYLENGFYIHASGLVHINSIDPNDPAYNVTEKKNLVSVSRILNSVNTEGIVLVKDHPWYSLP